MKSIFITLFVVATSLTSHAQSIASDNGVLFLYPNESEAAKNSNRRGSYIGTHPLGEAVSESLNKFEAEYVYYVKSSGAYAIEEKITIKRPIYNAVKKIEKFYLNKVLKAELSKEDGASAFIQILENAIKLTKFQTSKVETDLKKLNDPKDIIVYINEKIKFKTES
jgi:hypothetical protein